MNKQIEKTETPLKATFQFFLPCFLVRPKNGTDHPALPPQRGRKHGSQVSAFVFPHPKIKKHTNVIFPQFLKSQNSPHGTNKNIVLTDSFQNNIPFPPRLI